MLCDNGRGVGDNGRGVGICGDIGDNGRGVGDSWG